MKHCFTRNPDPLLPLHGCLLNRKKETSNNGVEMLEWHHTVLGLLQKFLLGERDITLVGEVYDFLI